LVYKINWLKLVGNISWYIKFSELKRTVKQ